MGESFEFVNGHVAYFRNTRCRPLISDGCKLIETHAVFLDELFVVHALVKKNLDGAQRKGSIRARTNFDPKVRPFAQGNTHGVDDGDLAAVLLAFRNELDRVHRGGRQVAAPGHE